MPGLICLRKSTLPLFTFVLIFAGCASKDDVSPVEVEKQAFDDLRSEIRNVIEDSAREAEAIAMVDALSEDLAALRQRISARKQKARELNADYDTTRADFENFFEQVAGQIQLNKQQVAARQRDLFASILPAERSAIAKAHTKAMDAAIRNIQSI